VGLQAHLVPDELRKGFQLGAREVFNAGLLRAGARRPKVCFQYRSAEAISKVAPDLLTTLMGDEDECVAECTGCGDTMIEGKGEGRCPK